MYAIIIDSETGDKDSGEVLELAYLQCRIANGGITSWGETAKRFKNTRPIAFGAMATHHILPDELAFCEPYNSAADCPRADFWIGHNVDFDWKACGAPGGVLRIDTLAISRVDFPECDSHSLSALIYYLTPAEDRKRIREVLLAAHSAAIDIQLTRVLLSKILLLHPEITSMELLWEYSEACRIPRVMTFGKHKGKPVVTVDPGYRKWYRGQPDPDPYLLQAFDIYPYDPLAEFQNEDN